MKMKKNRTEIELTQSERMLFALLKAALNESPAEAELFEEASDEEWLACYQLAVKQGVMALAWDGLCTLPPDLHPERPLRLTWGLGVSAQEERYHRYARTASELTEFYAKSGIRTVLLKGVGFAACYPIPAHREGGDIDIFTYSDGTWSWSDAQANNFADLLMEAQGIKVDRKHSVKHSMFPYQDIPVENHKRFVNVETCVAVCCRPGAFCWRESMPCMCLRRNSIRCFWLSMRHNITATVWPCITCAIGLVCFAAVVCMCRAGLTTSVSLIG
mgnify:CR=1 FL=1